MGFRRLLYKDLEQPPILVWGEGDLKSIPCGYGGVSVTVFSDKMKCSHVICTYRFYLISEIANRSICILDIRKCVHKNAEMLVRGP
jgi:hypothetical protein